MATTTKYIHPDGHNWKINIILDSASDSTHHSIWKQCEYCGLQLSTYRGIGIPDKRILSKIF